MHVTSTTRIFAHYHCKTNHCCYVVCIYVQQVICLTSLSFLVKVLPVACNSYPLLYCEKFLQVVGLTTVD